MVGTGTTDTEGRGAAGAVDRGAVGVDAVDRGVSTRVQRLDGWARTRPALVDAIAALALLLTAGPLTLGTVLKDPPAPGWTAVTLVAVAAMHGAVAFRRHAPVIAFAVAAAGEGVLALVPLVPPGEGVAYPVTLLPSGIAYLCCAYAVSAYGPAHWPRWSLVVGIVGAAAVTVRFATGPGFASSAPGGQVGGTLFAGAALLACVTAMWGLGSYRRWRLGQLQSLADRARRAEEDRVRWRAEAARDERARIAREMHDVVAHSLSVMVRQAEGGRYVTASDPGRATEVLRTIADTGREALRDMRSLLGVLRRDGHDIDDGGDGDPQPTLDDLPALVQRVRTSGLPVSLAVDGEPRPVDRAVDLAGFRLVQESLTNVVKHGGPAATAEVRMLWERTTLTVTVTDSGRPPGPTVAAPATGRGLVGMAERIALVGGTLHTGPGDDGGYRVVGRIPLSGTPGAGAR